MDRRMWLQVVGYSGIATLGGGGLFARRAWARNAVVGHMMDDALPPLAERAAADLVALPVRAREAIARYFHGRCLNVAGFVEHICSDAFADRLGRCRTLDDRDECFRQAFSSRIATEAEVLFQIETIAGELGQEIDAHWADYCDILADRWSARVRGVGPPVSATVLTAQFEGRIRNEITAAAAVPTKGGTRPAIGQTLEKIGASAILLLPLVQFGPTAIQVGVPVFVLLALRNLWDYVAGRLDDRRGDYRAAISGRLALLGNRIGTEFEQEVRGRLANLHTWQEEAVRIAAQGMVADRIGLFGGIP